MQMAAPTFVTNLNMHRAATAHTECEWKRGKGSAPWLTLEIGSKTTATAVLTDGLLMEAHFKGSGSSIRYPIRGTGEKCEPDPATSIGRGTLYTPFGSPERKLDYSTEGLGKERCTDCNFTL